MNQPRTKQALIVIPDNLDFSALRLTCHPNGTITYDVTVIERLCVANHIDFASLRDHREDGGVAELIFTWYAEHLRLGGACDAVQEALIEEVLEENALAGGYCHAPGTA